MAQPSPGETVVARTFSHHNGPLTGGSGPGAAWASEDLRPSSAAVSATPRHISVRSRVLLHRTQNGVSAVVPDKDLLAASHFHAEVQGSELFSRVVTKTTHFVGSGKARVPIELVDARYFALFPGRPVTSPGRVGGTTSEGSPHQNGTGRPAATPPAGEQAQSASNNSGGKRQWVFPGSKAEVPFREGATVSGGMASLLNQVDQLVLTPDLRQGIKTSLENMCTTARQDFQAHPRSLRFFLHNFNDFCDAVGGALYDSSRAQYGSHMFHHFVQLVPSVKDHAELPPPNENLSPKGWQALTVMLAIGQTSWEFQYNSQMHRLCDCKNTGGVCLVPFLPERPATRQKTPHHHPGGYRSARQAAPSVIGKEKHFPRELADLGDKLKKRFSDFLKQLPLLMEDFLAIPDILLPPPRHSNTQQLWLRFVIQALSEISVLGRAYTLFEKLYLRVVGSLLKQALEPIETMAGPAGVLATSPLDPFREVETAVMCQRLGLLKRKVNFGGSFNIVHFEPTILVKAKRALQRETYPEVLVLAEQLLQKFSALGEVLATVKLEQIKPELAQNPELRTAILQLEAVWGDCQYLLQQDTLDFMEQFLDFIKRSNPTATTRWQYRVGLYSDAEATAQGIKAEELQKCRKALFETLPILVFLDEVVREVEASREGNTMTHNCFRTVFCPQDQRLYTLRRDFGKFEGVRVEKFKNFLVGNQDESSEARTTTTTTTTTTTPPAEKNVEKGRARYFGMLYKQVKEVAAFSPEPRKTEFLGARDHWACVMKVAQQVGANLFPTSRPAEKAQGVSTAKMSSRPSLSRKVTEVMSGLPPANTRKRSTTEGPSLASVAAVASVQGALVTKAKTEAPRLPAT